MINSRRKRMRILVGEVHRLTTDPAYGLGLKNLEAGGFERPSVSFLSVCPYAHKQKRAHSRARGGNAYIALSPCACARGERVRTQKERRPMKSVAPVLKGNVTKKVSAMSCTVIAVYSL